MDAAFDDLQAMTERMVPDPDKPTSFLEGDPAWMYAPLTEGNVESGIWTSGIGTWEEMSYPVDEVMVVTRGRKPSRKMLLGLPVGTMLHLVFTGAWTDPEVFWWPFFGFGFEDAQHPIAARGWWNVPLELIGLALCWWVVQRAELRRPDRRDQFRTTGQLSLPIR